VWGDCTDGQARKRFRQSLLRLRRELAHAGTDPLVGDRDTLALDPAMVTVDAREFLALSAAGNEADLHRALDLYRGDLLDGISLEVEPFAEWVHQERSRFRAIAAQVFERGARSQEQRGDSEGAIAAAERLVALDASNEAAQRQLIDLLARHCGRTAALMRVEAVAQFVKDEFGCELEPETQELIAKLRSAALQHSDPKAAPREEPQAIGAAVAQSSSGSGESLPAAPAAGTRPRVPRPFLRSHSPAGSICTLGTDLGVHYAVEGDVRLEDGTVRINITLIDVTTRLQVWAERYERAEAERHAVQDDIVRALARQLHVSVMEVRGRAPAGQPGANATLGRAWAALNLFAFFRGGREAGQLFEEVLGIDPNNVSALTGLGTFKYATAATRPPSEDSELMTPKPSSG
jgi:DNA-binding SARP family transcriptional activator